MGRTKKIDLRGGRMQIYVVNITECGGEDEVGKEVE
jgi:hypothetical protein